MKNRVLYPILLFIYLAVVIIASAGAINSGEGICIAAGILNGIFGAWNAYTIYQNHIKVKK